MRRAEGGRPQLVGHNASPSKWRSKNRRPQVVLPVSRAAEVDERESLESGSGSDYDLDPFGPVDIDPTMTESEWLRSQGIDPEAQDDDGAGENSSPTVLSLAEVSYNRDIFNVNKAEREKFFRAANDLYGAQAVALEEKRSRRRSAVPLRPPVPPSAFYVDHDAASSASGSAGGRGRSRRGSGRSGGGRGPAEREMESQQSRQPTALLTKAQESGGRAVVVNRAPEHASRPMFVPAMISLEGMNPNARSFVPGGGLKT